MALIVTGMPCRICGQPMNSSQGLTTFTAFVSNQSDPVFFFNDAAFHTTCFEKHPLAEKAMKRMDEVLEHCRYDKRICTVCNHIITDPDDYFGFFHLTEDVEHPLYPYNYLHFHLSHLAEWEDLPRAYQLIKVLRDSGTWTGKGLDYLLQAIENSGEG
jgi:hypothetical protein